MHGDRYICIKTYILDAKADQTILILDGLLVHSSIYFLHHPEVYWPDCIKVLDILLDFGI